MSKSFTSVNFQNLSSKTDLFPNISINPSANIQVFPLIQTYNLITINPFEKSPKIIPYKTLLPKHNNTNNP